MDHYRMKREVSGGPGIRYLECEEASGKSVVVKEFSCSAFEELARHMREAIVLAELSHPNICKFIELIPSQDARGIKVSIVIEHIDRNLVTDVEMRRNADPQRNFTEVELRSFMRQMSSALQLANSKGIAHRDFNPEHIFINAAGEYKLSGFGTAWRETDHKVPGFTVYGQHTFMCPLMKAAKLRGDSRVSEGIQVDKVDTYSLAVTIIYMQQFYSPKKLDTNNNHDANVEEYLNLMRNDGISESLIGILRNMLKFNQNERFNATNVLEALSEPTPETRIAVALRTELCYFNFSSDAWIRTPYNAGASVNSNDDSASILLDKDSLICCGGGTHPYKHAYLVKTGGTVQTLAPMREGRGRHGLVYHQDSKCVFVFGGLLGTTALRSVEMLKKSGNKVDNAWTAQRDMRFARSCFNPCFHAGYIYLVGGGHPSMEVFDPHQNNYKDCAQLQIDPGVILAVPHFDKLVMAAPERVYRKSTSQDRIETGETHQPLPFWSNATPVVCHDSMFVATVQDGSITLLQLGAYSGRVLRSKK